jgi:hypothetical protein
MSTAELQSIDIDFEVFKELTMRRASASVTYNDVLRDLLKLEHRSKGGSTPTSNGTPWITKGVVFPHGTEFRATYKGKSYSASVDHGTLIFNSTKYGSLSPAAIAITGRPTNGWIFWQCRLPGQTTWKVADHYRK